MKFHIYHPEDTLRPYVKHYYHWEDETSGLITLPQSLFSLGDQYIVFTQQGEAACRPVQHAGFTLSPNAVIGHFTAACQLQVKGPVKMFAIQLNAYGCYRLLGFDMHALTNYYRNLDSHENPVWKELAAALKTLPDAEAAIAVLNGTLRHVLQQRPCDLRQVDEMADFLKEQQGNISIGRLSRRFHLSRPTLERRFTEIVGLPPQLYARMMRFKTAMQSLRQTGLPQWRHHMENAVYYNQAMFIRDYLLFNGEVPAYFEPAVTAAITRMPETEPVPVSMAI